MPNRTLVTTSPSGTVASSYGGNGAADADKIAQFDANGNLNAAQMSFGVPASQNGTQVIANSINNFTATLSPIPFTGNKFFTWPDFSGSFLTDGSPISSSQLSESGTFGRSLLACSSRVDALLALSSRRSINISIWEASVISGSAYYFDCTSQDAASLVIAGSTNGSARINSRNASVSTTPTAIFPGSSNVIDWSKGWALSWYGQVACGSNSGGFCELICGIDDASGTGFNGKGVGVKWTGGATQTAQIIVNNGTSNFSGSTASIGSPTSSSAWVSYLLVYLPGVGVTLYADGNLLCDYLTGANLPSGNGLTAQNGIQMTATNTTANASYVWNRLSFPTLTPL